MNRIVIPAANWSIVLSEAVRNADDQTVIIVNTEAKKELALRAASRLGKTVCIEIEETISQISHRPYTLEEYLRPVGRSECPRCYKPNAGETPCPYCGGG